MKANLDTRNGNTPKPVVEHFSLPGYFLTDFEAAIVGWQGGGRNYKGRQTAKVL